MDLSIVIRTRENIYVYCIMKYISIFKVVFKNLSLKSV